MKKSGETVNYSVFITDHKGHRIIDCETEEQVWAAIGSRGLEGLYEVAAYNGRSNRDFIPY